LHVDTVQTDLYLSFIIAQDSDCKYLYAYLGRQGTFPVAIPEALFKIVIKEGEKSNKPDVQAFIYPQVGGGNLARPYDHRRYLTTVDEIEKLTGVDFLTDLPSKQESALEKSHASHLWEVEKKDYFKAFKGS
jgi:endonuclease G